MKFFEPFLTRSLYPFILIVLSILWSTPSFGQGDGDCSNSSGVQLVLPDEIIGQPGDIVCMDLVVNGFDNVTIFLFTINFSSNFLRYDSANPLVSGLPSFSVSDVIPPFGPNDLDIIRVLWAQPNAQDESLPDGTVLIELCFEIIGDPGQQGVVHINSSGLNGIAEFVSSSGVNLPLCVDGDGAQVPIEPPFSPEPQIFITSNCGTPIGQNEGVAEISIFNGTGPYTIIDDLGNQFTLPNGQNRFIASNLSIGQRIYRVRDANGTLSVPLSIATDNAPPFDVSAQLIEPDCPLDTDGRINLTVSGGNPFDGNDYYYDWGTSQVGLGQNELKNITNGTYNISITDSLGCVQQESFTLQRAEIELVEIDRTNALCYGRDNGSITVGATGGGPFRGGRYNFTIEGTTDDGRLFLDSRTEVQRAAFTMLPPGQYVITALDSVDRRMNCADQDPFVIGVDQSITSAIMTPVGVACNDGEEARQIDFMSNGNLTFPLTVTILDSTGTEIANSPFTENTTSFRTACLPEGSYDISVRDNTGCTYDTSFLISGCSIVLTDTLLIQPQCNGDTTGSITVLASSPNGGISYTWSNGSTEPTVDMLSPGTYTVSITDQAACMVTADFVITSPETIDLTFDADSIQCKGLTGNIFAIPSGGTQPYSYSWSPNPNGSTGSVLSGVPVGVYSVTVTDANNCSATGSFDLVEPGDFSFDISNVFPPICAGEATGTALINARVNEFYTGPFSYLSSTNLNGQGANFSVDNYPAGTNWALISDGVCVSDTIYIVVPAQSNMRLDLDNSTIPDVSCYGDQGDDGAIVNLAGAGGNGSAIEFLWPDLGPNVMGNVQLGLAAGSYTVILENGADCRDTASISISQPDSLEVLLDPLSSSFARCGGDNNAELVIEHMGGNVNGSFVYRWEDSMGALVSSSLMASGLAPDTYTVSVTDENNCTTSISIDVMEPEPVIGFLGQVSDPLCFNDFGLIIIDSAVGGVPGYRFQVNTSPAQDISEPFSIIPGNHTVRVFDQNGCEWNADVVINNADELSVNAGPDIVVPLGRETELRAQIDNITPIDTILWTPDNTLSCILNNCQEVTVTPPQDQLYTVTVIDVNGCSVSDDVFVSLQSTRNIYIPNAIYPNSQISGNAFLRIFTGDGVQNIDYLRIFDRWGNMVHEERNLPPSLSGSGTWDGRYKGQDLEAGVYVYVVQITYIDNEQEIRKGDVTLIR